jgi:hypothetical protein
MKYPGYPNDGKYPESGLDAFKEAEIDTLVGEYYINRDTAFRVSVSCSPNAVGANVLTR